MNESDYFLRRLLVCNVSLWPLLIFTRLPSSSASLTAWMYLGLISSSLNTGNDPGVISLNKQDFTADRFPLKSTTVFPTYTGTVSPAQLPPEEWCDSIRGLVEPQATLCKRNPSAFRQISYAAKLTVQECQHQFRNDIWNCSIANKKHVFHKLLQKDIPYQCGFYRCDYVVMFDPKTVLKKSFKHFCSIHAGTKETAFVTALSSASLVEAVVRGCSSGNVGNCSCDTRSHSPLSSTGTRWKWEGCGENVDYGLAFARQFNDATEEVKRHDARSVTDAMHLHNKAVGRKVFGQLIQKKCRCHGVSGSCEMRTCWRQLSTFRNISTALKSRYGKAVQISKKYNGKLQRKGKAKKKGPVEVDSLVYLQKSPDYCHPDHSKGIRGTSGRICNATADGPGSCRLLCCNRGHRSLVVRKTERCQCRFIYCCKVECKECSISREISICN